MNEEAIDPLARPMRLLHIAVNYNTQQKALDFVDSFRRSRSAPSVTSLVVVDNSNGTERGQLPELVHGRYPDVHCIAAPNNLGYFGGARFGVERALRSGIGAGADWIAVSNVDLSYDHGALEQSLLRHRPDEVAAVAPRILSSHYGSELNPFMRRRPSASRMHAYRYLFRYYHGMRLYAWLGAAIKRNFRPVAPRARMASGESIYAAHGSFLILSRGYFDRGGSLRHPPFLFGEEFSIAEQARRIGLPIVCEPDAVVTHHDHASTGELPGRTMHAFHLEASEWVAKEYFS